jgi:hypothetical protein
MNVRETLLHDPEDHQREICQQVVRDSQLYPTGR